jgi:hypothetical protein
MVLSGSGIGSESSSNWRFRGQGNDTAPAVSFGKGVCRMVQDPKQSPSRDESFQSQDSGNVSEGVPQKRDSEDRPATERPPMRQPLVNLDNAAILAEVKRVCQHLGLRVPSAQRRVEEDLKLQYYFGGQDVAFLETSQGRVVVAQGILGTGEFRCALQSLSLDERRRVIVRFVDPWDHPSDLAPTPFPDED